MDREVGCNLKGLKLNGGTVRKAMEGTGTGKDTENCMVGMDMGQVGIDPEVVGIDPEVEGID